MYMTRGNQNWPLDSEKGCLTGKDYIQYWNKDDEGRKVRQGIYVHDRWSQKEREGKGDAKITRRGSRANT
jgi:hypothetical protein